MKTYDGFIDMHVHLRDPGATQKEDFESGTRAAVAGGFIFIADMPNNPVTTVSVERLDEKNRLMKAATHCPVGFHFGTDGTNTSVFHQVWDRSDVYGLKIYCNHTTGTLLIEDPTVYASIFSSWNSDKPILVHAEGERLSMMIANAEKYARRLHVCHISTASDITQVRDAKKMGIRISAGVTPHHLFLTNDDVKRLGSHAIMRPSLGTKDDQDALWEAMTDRTIDIVESDHAPHTLDEKKNDPAPFGVPGLETTMGLLFHAVADRRLDEQRLIELCFSEPKRIFHVPVADNTAVSLDTGYTYRIGEHGYQTKCGWSPFDGMEACGRIASVIISGQTVYDGTSFYPYTYETHL
jgi:carbamoyl-phosphate synthase/aspartate carbamoyltransferase/dihydroorotase